VSQIKKIKKLSLGIFIIPLLTINICLFIVVYFAPYLKLGDGLPLVIPYIDGGSSISRTARVFPSYFIFKPAMIFTGFLLMNYWIQTHNVVQKFNTETRLHVYFKFFGIASGVFLILHSIFLGIKFDLAFYKLFRRLVILCFIIFELVAQTMFLINLVKIKKTISKFYNQKILKLKIILVSILVFVAIASIPIVSSSGFTRLKHALEWDFFVGVLLFYLLTYFFWREKK